MARKRNLKVSFDDAMIKKFGLRDIRPIKNNGGIEEEYCRDLIAQNNWKLYT